VILVAIRWKILRECIPNDICPIKLQSGYISFEEAFFLICILTFLMRLIVSILEGSSIFLSTYFWLSSYLVSNECHVKIMMYCNTVVMYHGALTIIRRYLYFGIFGIFLYLNWRSCSMIGHHKSIWELPCITGTYFQSIIVI